VVEFRPVAGRDDRPLTLVVCEASKELPMASKPRSRSASMTVLQWNGLSTRGAMGVILKAVRSRFDDPELKLGRRMARDTTYLDTADRRLRRQGLVLRHEQSSGPGELVLSGQGIARSEPSNPRSAEPPDPPLAGSLSQPLVETPVWPALMDRLPPGAVRDEISPAAGIRALMPLARARVVSRSLAVLNGQAEAVARLVWVESRGIERAASVSPAMLYVQAVPGRRRVARAIVAALLEGGEFGPAVGDVHERLLEDLDSGSPDDRGPIGDRREPITGTLPADVAVATALRGFSEIIVATAPGVIADIDTEFLHELRVAVRRTRSLLKQAGDVLPAPLATRYAPGFKWLGDLTTPTRDLDVYLLEFDQLAASLVAGSPSDLDPFAAFLRRHRDAQWRSMCRGLRSQRFTRLLSGWQTGLDAVLEAGPDSPDSPDGLDGLDGVLGSGGVRTARALAANRIRRSSRRVTRLASTITPDSPAEQVHALRKRCKELRYVLEAFQPLCEPGIYRAVVKDLRRLQDVLGTFQDGEVQSLGLREFAEQLLAGGKAPASTLLAMGELSARFAHQQHQARADLTDRLERYLHLGTRIRVRELLG
jgi:CHAD domain-containing protein